MINIMVAIQLLIKIIQALINTEISISLLPNLIIVLRTLVTNLSKQRLSCMDSANGDIDSQASDYAGKVEEKKL